MAAAAEIQPFSLEDVVHGHVEYPQYIKSLIRTVEYRRLLNLKQLGVSSQFFTSGTHTRYEHCLGVCYLALKLMKILEQNSAVTITETHRKCVTIAALFHDIGHGPFSHLWEDVVKSLNPEREWSHEQTSVDIVGHMFQKYNWVLKDSPEENTAAIQLIQALIIGDTEVALEYLGAENMYLSEIVNNKFTQIDVDKWDYILRDAYYLRGNIELDDFTQLFDNVRVAKDADGVTHISYHINDFDKIINLFTNRANLHIRCYQEPTIRGVEHLLIEILKISENAGFLLKEMRLSELHEDLERYNYLNDSILEIIRSTQDPRLAEAKELIERYYRGDFYHLIWMSPHLYNLEVLKERFGDHFLQLHKRVPLPCVFIRRHFLLHDDDGHKAQVPTERLTRRDAYYEEYLIYSKSNDPELIQAAYDFLTDIQAEP